MTACTGLTRTVNDNKLCYTVTRGRDLALQIFCNATQTISRCHFVDGRWSCPNPHTDPCAGLSIETNNQTICLTVENGLDPQVKFTVRIDCPAVDGIGVTGCHWNGQSWECGDIA